MDDDAKVSGPFAASPSVRLYDLGDHPLNGDQPWWLITDTNSGWRNGKRAACAAPAPAVTTA